VSLTEFLHARPALRAWGLIAPALLWSVVFFGVPLLLVVVYAVSTRPADGGVEFVFTWENLREATWPADPVDRRILWLTYWRTAWLGAATTLLCLLISYPTAYFIAVRASAKWKPILLTAAVLPFWTSFVVRTFAWMYLLDVDGPVTEFFRTLGLADENRSLMRTDLGLLLGLVYGELPLMILPLYTSLERLDRRLLEAAADLGAGPVQTFRHVTLPLSKPGITAGAILVLIPSLGAFVTSDMFTRGTRLLVGNLIDLQVNTSANNPPLAGAYSVVLTAATAVLLFIALRAGAKPLEDHR